MDKKSGAGIGLAITLVGVGLPIMLPDLWWIGALLVLSGALVLSYELLPRFRDLVSPALGRLPIWPGEHVTVTAWVSVTDAIDHVVASLEYRGTTDADDTELFFRALKVLRQAALEGNIEMRGQIETNRDMPWERHSQAWTRIPPEYWAVMEISAMCTDSTATDEPHTQVESSRASDPQAESTRRYFNVEVYRPDLKRRWPKRRKYRD